MKKIRFTEEQMVTILREADRSPVAELKLVDENGGNASMSGSSSQVTTK